MRRSPNYNVSVVTVTLRRWLHSHSFLNVSLLGNWGNSRFMRIRRAIYPKFFLGASCKRLKVLCHCSETRGRVMTDREFSLSEIMSCVFWDIFTSITCVARDSAGCHRRRDDTRVEG